MLPVTSRRLLHFLCPPRTGRTLPGVASARAAAAFTRFRGVSIAERAARLERAAEILEGEKESLGRLMTAVAQDEPPADLSPCGEATDGEDLRRS